MRLALFHAIRRSRALHKVPLHHILAPVSVAVVLSSALATDATAQVLSAAPAAAPASAPAAAAPAMKPLGGERYQIGSIVVDRKARQMTIPARVHVVDRPLEYLLTAKGGMKEYESLLETDVTGTELNLACILLGLERDKTQEPYLQFSQKRVSGPRIDIVVARKDGNRTTSVAAGEVLFDTGQKAPEPVEWVYTGSQKHWQDDRFAADVTGTLIGFVHDPNTIIESAMGLGIGAYGSVNGNTALLPPVGADVDLVITVPGVTAGKK
jgi:hypothetical protein